MECRFKQALRLDIKVIMVVGNKSHSFISQSMEAKHISHHTEPGRVLKQIAIQRQEEGFKPLVLVTYA